MSETASTAGAPSSGTFNILAMNVNIVALIAAVVLSIVGVKLTAFLPSKYYFSFSQFVDTGHNTSPFLISTPGYVSGNKFCELLANDPRIKQLRCDQGNQNDEEQPRAGQEEQNDQERQSDQNAAPSGPGTPDYDKEVQIANKIIRESIRSQDITANLIALAIRLCIPLIVGFFVGRYFGPSGQVAAAIGAATGALFLCWPVIVLWDLVVTEAFRPLWGQFLLLYVLGCVLFFYMARIGAIFGAQTSAFAGPRISVSKIVESSIGAIVVAVGTKYVEHLILNQ